MRLLIGPGILGLIGAVALSGCATEVANKWVRTDGQSVMNNPALVKQFEIDKTICEGEMQKANLSGSSYCSGVGDCIATGIARGSAMAVVGKGCMAQRGYLLTPDPDAPAPGPAFVGG
jgi:hypothetical protein